MDAPDPRKSCPRCFSSSKTIGVNNVLVALDTAYGNYADRKFFITKVLDVITNFVAQLSQTARESIVNNVSGYSVAPGWVPVSG
jgi:hypothetical protein